MASWSGGHYEEQTVWLAPRATSFTVVCDACRAIDTHGYGSATTSGSLELDVDHATFLCRRGHRIRVVRAVPLTLR